jgi:hypothetical protein
MYTHTLAVYLNIKLRKILNGGNLTLRLNEGYITISLCSVKLHTMKMFEGLEVWLHIFVTSALDGVEWSA